MAKEKKKMNITEAVGDTSGFNEGTQSSPKRRKIILFSSLGVFIVFILIIIFLFKTPIKIEFYYQDGATPVGRYVVDSKTKLLEDGPQDPTRYYYIFSGWYFNSETTQGSGFYNNNDDKTLLEHKFTEGKKIILYARWVAQDYTITYDCKGNGNFNSQVVNNLETQNKNIGNPSKYTVKHTLSSYERNQYAEYLRQSDPDTYVKDKNAQTNLTNALELYVNETQKASQSLANLTQAGWTFVGWFDNDGNQVTELNRLDPKDLSLTARWQKN